MTSMNDRTRTPAILAIVACASVALAGCAGPALGDIVGPDEIVGAELEDREGIWLPDPESFDAHQFPEFPSSDAQREWESILEDVAGVQLTKLFVDNGTRREAVLSVGAESQQDNVSSAVSESGSALLVWYISDDSGTSASTNELADAAVSLFGGEASSATETDFTTSGGIPATLARVTIEGAGPIVEGEATVCVVAASDGAEGLIAIAFPADLATNSGSFAEVDADCTSVVVGFANRASLTEPALD